MGMKVIALITSFFLGTIIHAQEVPTYNPDPTSYTLPALTPPSTTYTSPPRNRVVRQPGPTWSYNGADLAGHLRSVHGVDPTGMSYKEQVDAHSNAHNSSRSVRSTRPQFRFRRF